MVEKKGREREGARRGERVRKEKGLEKKKEVEQKNDFFRRSDGTRARATTGGRETRGESDPSRKELKKVQQSSRGWEKTDATDDRRELAPIKDERRCLSTRHLPSTKNITTHVAGLHGALVRNSCPVKSGRDGRGAEGQDDERDGTEHIVFLGVFRRPSRRTDVSKKRFF